FPEMVVIVTAEERIDWVIESGVQIIETSGRSPGPYRQQIVDAGLIHIHKCARVRDAVKMDGLGLDLISVVGTECGGHPSMEEVTTLALIPTVLDKITTPLIAGGGFADGKGLMAALALGASAVNFGTRFLATQECPAHPNIKQLLVDSSETDTVLVMKTLNNPGRVLKTPGALKVIELESQGAGIEELAPYISGKTALIGWQTGEIDKGLYDAGQVMGRINDIPTVAELIDRIVGEAVVVKKNLDALF
ncbi:MAG: nitronate monooxygenase, partial [Deltaproteobacteria bacterium]|nr:nitronate monooxygenase [Deltaproteobacteria bacterium]